MRIAISVLLAVSYSVALSAATSVTYDGFTWTFDGDYTVGTFVGGEPYVVAPSGLQITDISPDDTDDADATYVHNGSEINPVPNRGTQGFTSRYSLFQFVYDPALNVSLSYPFSLSPGDALVSSMTGEPSSTNDYCTRMAVLTVLASAPAANSFRPQPYGTDRAIKHNASDVDWSILQNLTGTAATPAKADIDEVTPDRAWLEFWGHAYGSRLQPLQNTYTWNPGIGDGQTQLSNYGAFVAEKLSNVALWLNTDQTTGDKQRIFYRMLQIGIDIAGYCENYSGGPVNNAYQPDGGQNCGMKIPVVMAAGAFGSQYLLDLCATDNVFQEDCQTFYVAQADVDRVKNPALGVYTEADIGMPEYGIKHSTNPEFDDSRWETGVAYRFVGPKSWRGALVAAEVMGLISVWHHDAIFDYNKRHIDRDGAADNFAGQMYAAYAADTYLNPWGAGAPTAPSSLSAAAPGSTQIVISWTDNASDETGFKIERSLDDTNWTQIGTAPANATSYTDSGLAQATQYYYRVRAYNGAGDSAYTSSATATTLDRKAIRANDARSTIGGALLTR